MSSGIANKYTQTIYEVIFLVPIPCSPGNPCLALITTDRRSRGVVPGLRSLPDRHALPVGEYDRHRQSLLPRCPHIGRFARVAAAGQSSRALAIRVSPTQAERDPAVRPVGQQLVDEAVGVPRLAARRAGTARALPSPTNRGSAIDRLVEPPKAVI